MKPSNIDKKRMAKIASNVYDYDRQTILKKIRNGRVKFDISVDFGELAKNMKGLDFLNQVVDEVVENGYLLEDIFYTPSTVHRGRIIIRVNASAESYKNEDLGE